MVKWLPITGFFLLLAACAQTRTVTIRAVPPDAAIRIDDVDRGPGPITQTFSFDSPTDAHRVFASRAGYRDKFDSITADSEQSEVVLNLQPETRRINIRVEPAPAIVRLDGRPLSTDPVSAISTEAEMAVDSKGQPVQYTLTAERDNFQTAKRIISRQDRDLAYILTLETMKKTINVNTEPAGAEIFLDQQRLGVSPLNGVQIDLPVDLETNEFEPHKLSARKNGYDSGEVSLSWDNGRADYHIDLQAKSKEIRLFVDPPGATVVIDGTEVPNDPSDITIQTLKFPPINEKGDLKTYGVSISKKSDDFEWIPQQLNIAWEEGRTDYRVALKEVLDQNVKLLSPVIQRRNNGWEIAAQTTDTLASRETSEPPGRPRPKQVTRLPKETQIGSFALSPDGSKIIYTVLSGKNSTDFRSQMFVINSDGSGQPRAIGDGKYLDLTPSFTPGADQIVFSSNREGKRLKVFAIPADGSGTPARLSAGDTDDLWPVIDGDPKPRLFYQAMVDARPDARLHFMQLGNGLVGELTNISGMQPRIGPRNDAVVFSSTDSKTGKRDIFLVSDKGGTPRNLTDSPAADECDPSFSRDGRRIVFASDRGVDEQGRHNFGIWMIDVAKPERPVQLTFNGSQDDMPVFDVLSDSVYFRSNRGGQWQTWKIAIK